MPCTSMLQDALSKIFGFNTFRAGQHEAITTLLQQGRLLCVLPTGYGKSLLYQLPAVLLDGLTVVISPLLALMRDQLQHLNQRFGIPAASFNSDQSPEENRTAALAAKAGRIRILFVAPEQLDQIDKFNFLLQLPVALIVVDEAHCISTWGHDFRPSYRQIIAFVRQMEQKNAAIKVLGLTATADTRTERDILEQLSNPAFPTVVHRASLYRDNIALRVVAASGVSMKLTKLLNLLQHLPANGIIYCATRENTGVVADFLQTKNIQAVAYHAGLPAEEKQTIQQQFISNQFPVIVATNALGMGIDKSDLRFIIHFDMPGSITAYYQEVGRCGRDGKPAFGILLYDPSDKKVQHHFINSAQPEARDFQLVLEVVQKKPLSLLQIKKAAGLHPTRTTVVIAELCEQKFLLKQSQQRKQVYFLSGNSANLDLSRYENQRRVRIESLQAMIQYAEQKQQCRMHLLCEALSDDSVKKCGYCDVCQPMQKNTEHNISDNLTDTWLTQRVVKIMGTKRPKMEEGVAVLDGKLRANLFIEFMKTRATEDISTELKELILKNAMLLHQRYDFKALVPLPSRTWQARDSLSLYLSQALRISLFPHLLIWQATPKVRQGELLNNDQRSANVHLQMNVSPQKHYPRGNILLFDDYIGSGATLKEATRTLREHVSKSINIVPFAIAAVKWRLGSQGMI